MTVIGKERISRNMWLGGWKAVQQQDASLTSLAVEHFADTPSKPVAYFHIFPLTVPVKFLDRLRTEPTPDIALD